MEVEDLFMEWSNEKFGFGTLKYTLTCEPHSSCLGAQETLGTILCTDIKYTLRKFWEKIVRAS